MVRPLGAVLGVSDPDALRGDAVDHDVGADRHKLPHALDDRPAAFGMLGQAFYRRDQTAGETPRRQRRELADIVVDTG